MNVALSSAACSDYPKEMRSVIYDGILVAPSTLEKSHFMKVFEEEVSQDFKDSNLVSEWYDENKKAFEEFKNKDGTTGIVRDTGEPYFNHVASAAMNAMQLLPKCDVDMVLALLAHDTPEDTGAYCLPPEEWEYYENGLLARKYVDLDKLAAKVGLRAARMIAAVQKPKLCVNKNECTPEQLEIYRQAKCDQIVYDREVAAEALILKMFDRSHNLMTVGDEDKTKKMIIDTRERLMKLIEAEINDDDESDIKKVLRETYAAFKYWFDQWCKLEGVPQV